MHRAREFNLSRSELDAAILGPWLRGETIELGDREWPPRDSALKILEGEELSLPELGIGQGWSNAERSARNVTTELLESPGATASGSIAVLAETLTAQLAVAALLEQLGLKPVEWAAARSRIAEIGFALLVIEEVTPSGTWLFEAGLAVGALGGRVAVAQFGSEDPPIELQRFEVIPLGPDDATAVRALEDGLNRAGLG
jgi:hypothetical protein